MATTSRRSASRPEKVAKLSRSEPLHEPPAIRLDKVRRAQERIAAGYYDRKHVRSRLLEVLAREIENG